MDLKTEASITINHFIEKFESVEGFQDYVLLNTKDKIFKLISLKATLRLFQEYSIKEIIQEIEAITICQNMIEFVAKLEAEGFQKNVQ